MRMRSMASGKRDEVVVGGLNPSAPREAAELKRLGNRVTLISNAKVSGQIRVGSRVYDLSQDADLDAYVGTFSLAKTQADAAVKALKQISSGLRDEFGKLVG